MTTDSTVEGRKRGPGGRRPGRRRGAVVIMVIVTLLLAAFALTRLSEQVFVDLNVEVQSRPAQRVRLQAYSMLETTLAVLAEFKQVDGALYSPAQGWGDPLEYLKEDPPEGMTVRVTFEDEGARVSLPQADEQTLQLIFEQMGYNQTRAAELADALMGWTDADHAPSTFGARPDQYEREAIPYEPPCRPLRSFMELAAVALLQDEFFDEEGRPNDRLAHFASLVSLYEFDSINLNSALSGTLNLLADYDDYQVKVLKDYLSGATTGGGAGVRPPYLRSAGEAQEKLGLPAAGDDRIGAEIRILTVTVEVSEGVQACRIRAVVDVRSDGQDDGSEADEAAATDGGGDGTSLREKLRYPFTLLEFQENDVSQELTARGRVTPTNP